MARFPDLDPGFCCPHRNGCPYLEGLPTQWVRDHYQAATGTWGQYEHILKELNQELDQARGLILQQTREIQQLKAQFQALHRRQFKGRKAAAADDPLEPPSDTRKKKRGAPAGHPAWVRPKPKRIDCVVSVPAPQTCPYCQCAKLTPTPKPREHLQEDMVLEPRVVTTRFVHQLAHCPQCQREVSEPGPGELLGSYIGPATKATAIYLRYQLNVPVRKISQFFEDFFGLKFVPASAYGFERQAVRRGHPLYADLLDKVRALAVVHADETSWRHAGRNYWVWYGGDNDLAAFRWDAHRSTDSAQKLLGNSFGGVIVADAYAAYNGVHPKDRQSCLAHIQTKAKELDQELALLKGRGAEPRTRQFCQKVQGLVHAACQAHRQLSQGPWRAKRAKAKGQSLRNQLNQIGQTPLRHLRTESFRQRLLGKEQKLLFTCFRWPNVPPTNNQAERSLRPVVIMRRVIQGTRSDKGLENHSVLRSLFETARRQGKKPHRFFLDLFTKSTVEAQASLYRKSLDTKSAHSKSSPSAKPP